MPPFGCPRNLRLGQHDAAPAVGRRGPRRRRQRGLEGHHQPPDVGLRRGVRVGEVPADDEGVPSREDARLEVGGGAEEKERPPPAQTAADADADTDTAAAAASAAAERLGSLAASAGGTATASRGAPPARAPRRRSSPRRRPCRR